MTDWHLDYLPQQRTWLLVLLLAASVAAVVYLYRAQARIASRRAVGWLTVLRVCLLVLVFLALFGPFIAFTRSGSAQGTLWVLVDQSGSMSRSDPQATPLERLRWAKAAGFLPVGVQVSECDALATRLRLLADDWSHLALPTAGAADVNGDPQPGGEARAARARDWAASLEQTVAAIGRSAEASSLGETFDRLRSIARGIDAEPARWSSPSTTTPPVPDGGAAPMTAADAASNDERTRVLAALAESAARLNTLADQADERLLQKKDPGVEAAVERVGKTPRNQLARAVVAGATSADGSNGAAAGGSGAGGSGAGGLAAALPRQKLKIVTFGQRPQTATPSPADAARALGAAFEPASESATDLASAFQTVLDQSGETEPASVVVISDGRLNRGESLTTGAARRLADRGVRVYTVGVGSRQTAADAVVQTVDAADWVFKGDPVTVRSLLRLDGLTGKTVTVDLRRTPRHADANPADSKLLASQQIAVTSARQIVSFAEKAEDAAAPGSYDYRVEVRPVADEAVTTNNALSKRVSVREDKLSILMIEDQPRWEWRYAANFLSRDARVKLQTMLLQPARIGWDPDPKKNIQPPPDREPSTDDADPRQDFQILPKTQADWYRWKLIVIGDVPPERISRQQQEMIVRAVRDNGSTLLLVAGPLNMPAAWGTGAAENPLVELLPCEPSPLWTPALLQQQLQGGFHPVLSPDGMRHTLSQLGIDELQNDQVWQSIMTDPNLAWYYHSEFTQPKGAASVLWSVGSAAPSASAMSATTRPATQSASAIQPGTGLPAAAASLPSSAHSDEPALPQALLATMNAGLGKVMYLSGDATWRFRQVNGSNYHERLWGQIMRWSAEDELPAGGRYVRFGTDKPSYIGGETAVVTARVVNKDLVPHSGLKIRVVARQTAGGSATRPSDMVASAAATSPANVDAEMTEIPDAPGRYRAVLSGLPNGTVSITLEGDALKPFQEEGSSAAAAAGSDGVNPATARALTIDVNDVANLEDQNVNADFATLASLATAGGGSTVDGDLVGLLPEHLPPLTYTATSRQQIGLFGNPDAPYTRRLHYAFLLLFAALAATEWIVRKSSGLL